VTYDVVRGEELGCYILEIMVVLVLPSGGRIELYMIHFKEHSRRADVLQK
jgi:hypothetical protein